MTTLTDEQIAAIAQPFLHLGDGDTEHDSIDWLGFARAMLSASKPAALNTLFEVLMQQNIVTSEESYLSLKCVGTPPTEEEFVRAVQRTIAASPAKPAQSGEPFDAEDHQVLLGYDESGDAIFGTVPNMPAQSGEPVAWRELCRRLYVELFHCDQQMRSTRDEDDEPHWTQSSVVRDVLADAKIALETAGPTQQDPVGEFVGYQKIGFQQVPIIAWNRHVAMGTKLYAAPQPAQTAQSAEQIVKLPESTACFAPGCHQWDGSDSCTCRRSAVVLDDERAAAFQQFLDETADAERPYARGALVSCIAECQALSYSEDRGITVSEAESIGGVLLELRRLQKLEADAVEVLTRAASSQPMAQPRALAEHELTALIHKIQDDLGIYWFVPDDSERYLWRTINTEQQRQFARALVTAAQPASGDKA